MEHNSEVEMLLGFPSRFVPNQYSFTRLLSQQDIRLLALQYHLALLCFLAIPYESYSLFFLAALT